MKDNSVTVRIPRECRDILQSLAEHAGVTMQDVLANLIASEQRRRFFEEANQAYHALQADSAAYGREMKRREVLDHSLTDGLEGYLNGQPEAGRGVDGKVRSRKGRRTAVPSGV